MHPNPAYRKTRDSCNLAFTRERGFGVLVLNGETVPLISHVPFILADDNGSLEMHLVRSNPIAQALGKRPLQAVLAVSGPDSYVSPDWYAQPNQVPTWNYVAVHLEGTLELLPQQDLHPHLERLSHEFETRLLPKPVWLLDKVSPEHLDRLSRMIVPARLTISATRSTWKLAQNKDEVMRLAAAEGVAMNGFGCACETLAELMRAPPEEIA